MRHTYAHHRPRSIMAALAVMAAVVVAVTLSSATGAWAEGDPCGGTGYRACGGPSAAGGTGGALGSAIAAGDTNTGSTSSAGGGDLPITGTSPVRTVVIASAFILVGVAAVGGSLQARRRDRTTL